MAENHITNTNEEALFNTKTNGGNIMTENITNNENVIEMKFRCPMEFAVAPADIEKDCYEVAANHFADHADEINKLIRESFGIDGAEGCGLAAYIKNPLLAERIVSAVPSVENQSGELCGVVTVTIRGELTEAETTTLTNELRTQIDEGWGCEFGEELFNVGDEDVYISFLCAKDGEYFQILNESEDIEPTMGGIS